MQVFSLTLAFFLLSYTCDDKAEDKIPMKKTSLYIETNPRPNYFSFRFMFLADYDIGVGGIFFI